MRHYISSRGLLLPSQIVYRRLLFLASLKRGVLQTNNKHSVVEVLAHSQEIEAPSKHNFTAYSSNASVGSRAIVCM